MGPQRGAADREPRRTVHPRPAPCKGNPRSEERRCARERLGGSRASLPRTADKRLPPHPHPRLRARFPSGVQCSLWLMLQHRFPSGSARPTRSASGRAARVPTCAGVSSSCRDNGARACVVVRVTHCVRQVCLCRRSGKLEARDEPFCPSLVTFDAAAREKALGAAARDGGPDWQLGLLTSLGMQMLRQVTSPRLVTSPLFPNGCRAS